MNPFSMKIAQPKQIAVTLMILAISLAACAGDPDASAWRKAGLPEWLPAYPGTMPDLLSEGKSDGDLVGLVSFSVAEDPKASGKIYKELLITAEFKVRLFPVDTPGGRTWRLEADDESDTRGVYVTISPTDSGSNFILNYSEAQ